MMNMNETETMNSGAKVILDSMDRMCETLDDCARRINKVPLKSWTERNAKELSQKNERVKVSKKDVRLDNELSRKFERLGYDINDIENIKKMRLQALINEFKAMKTEGVI